ncbi:MAG: glycosyltransferase family 4 protein [Syntrophothermus sp.]
MRVIILASLFYEDTAATAKRMTHLAEDLVAQGHEVVAITGSLRGEGRSASGLRPRAWMQTEDYHGIKVIRTWTYVPGKKTFIRRLVGFLSFMASSPFAVARLKGKYDVLVAVSPPLFSGISAFIISRLKRVPFVFDVEDIYPETAIVLGVLKNTFLIRVNRWLERFIYRVAAKIVVISEGFKVDITIQKRVKEAKVRVIPNWADWSAFKPVNADGLRNEQGWQNKFVVMFAGNVGLAQGLTTLIEAARMLEAHPDIQFVIAGEGIEKERLIKLSESYRLSNMTFLPARPHVKVPELLAAADVCLVHLRRNSLYRITIPSKTYEYMAAGKPVLMGALGEAQDLVEKAGCGIGFVPEDAEDLAASVLKLYKHPEQRKAMGENGRRHAVENYHRHDVTGKYIQVLQEVAHQTKNR